MTPIGLYARLVEASAELGRYITIRDTHEPTLAQPLEAAWQRLDDLIEQIPASLVQDYQPQEETP